MILGGVFALSASPFADAGSSCSSFKTCMDAATQLNHQGPFAGPAARYQGRCPQVVPVTPRKKEESKSESESLQEFKRQQKKVHFSKDPPKVKEFEIYDHHITYDSEDEYSFEMQLEYLQEHVPRSSCFKLEKAIDKGIPVGIVIRECSYSSLFIQALIDIGFKPEEMLLSDGQALILPFQSVNRVMDRYFLDHPLKLSEMHQTRKRRKLSEMLRKKKNASVSSQSSGDPIGELHLALSRNEKIIRSDQRKLKEVIMQIVSLKERQEILSRRHLKLDQEDEDLLFDLELKEHHLLVSIELIRQGNDRVREEIEKLERHQNHPLSVPLD